jgi:hypothetical protein
VKEIFVARGWPKPSIQSFGMRHRIFEIGRLASADGRIFEVHPEVSFRELVGRSLAPKRAAAGASERRLALARAGIEHPDLPYRLRSTSNLILPANTREPAPKATTSLTVNRSEDVPVSYLKTAPERCQGRRKPCKRA